MQCKQDGVAHALQEAVPGLPASVIGALGDASKYRGDEPRKAEQPVPCPAPRKSMRLAATRLATVHSSARLSGVSPRRKRCIVNLSI
jgi:hypothetical protein